MRLLTHENTFFSYCSVTHTNVMMKNAYTHIKRWKIPIYSLSNPAKISFFYVSWLKLPGTRKIKWGICFCFFSFIMISSTLQLMSTQLLLLRNEVRSIEGEEETDCKYETTGYFLQQSFVVTKTGTLSYNMISSCTFPVPNQVLLWLNLTWPSAQLCHNVKELI